jgi:hypothetical protein
MNKVTEGNIVKKQLPHCGPLSWKKKNNIKIINKYLFSWSDSDEEYIDKVDKILDEMENKDSSDENSLEEWSDETGRNEGEKLRLNFKLKNKIERDFYEDHIIQDKYKNLKTYEISIYHHRSRYTYGGNAELNLWEKDKKYLIRSWEELKKEFFKTQTIKQKHSHLKAFEYTMNYKPIVNFTGKHKELNDELRKDDNEHLMKMKAEIERLDKNC